MMFNVLKTYHVMVGIPWIEKHDAIFPPSPTPVPKVPHVCGAMLCVGPWGALTGKPNPREISASGGVMLSQCTDIGPLIPHYNLTPPAPPNALLPVIILCSGSKSHFGASSHAAPKGPVAFACAKVVNFNLNCAGPAFPPLPSGLVFTFNTHTTGVTFGDLVAGALHMAVDGLIQFGLNRLFSRARPTELGERIMERLLTPLFNVTGIRNVAAMFGFSGLGRWVGAAVEEGLYALPLTAAAVFGVGSPVGYSPGYTPGGGSENWWSVGTWTDRGHAGVQRAVDKLINSPSVEQHPSQAPAPAAGPSTP